MSERFEGLSRAMAASTSRRGILKVFGGAAIGAVAATVLRPIRGYSASCTAGQTPCGSSCCPPGTTCIKASTGTCGCPSGSAQCGTNPSGPGPFCCSGTCADQATNCCCDSGTTPCGPGCCAGGVACIDRTNGLCGCPAGYKSCGTASNRTCCPAGKACGDPSCASPATLGTKLKTCCPAGQTLCSGVCKDLQNDVNNCGSCATACTGGRTCQSGTCACPSGRTICSGVCKDLNADPNNCGSCGNTCPSATPFCLNGSCSATSCNTCIAGQACQNLSDCQDSGGACLCWPKADGSGCFCGVNVVHCVDTTLCPNGQSDCPTGEVCVGTCGCGNFCVPPCPPP